MKDNLVYVQYMTDEGAVTKRAQILYWGHSFEYVPTPVTRMIDSFLVKDESQMPMQVISVVVRVLDTGEVIQLKPEAIRFDKTSEKITG